jgi:hypothetical protein
MRDAALIQQLIDLCADADRRHRATETIDSWAHYDPRGVLAATRTALLSDPVVAGNAVPGTFLYVAGSSGWGFDLSTWLAGFVREAEQLAEELRRREAERFLAFIRLNDGVAPMQVRTTLAGVKLDEGLVLKLPFGRLRAALPSDFSAPHPPDLPPAAVFEYETGLPAKFASTNAYPFGGEPGAALARKVDEEHDDAVARVLLALVLAGEGPVQEHLTMRAPRYLGGGSGMNPIPLAPIVVSYPYFLAEGARADELLETAALVTQIPIGRLGIVARRYLMAVTERPRPADQIIDYSIAFEALTSTGRGREQGKALAELIGKAPSAFGTVLDEHRLVKDARDVILHEGKTPAEAPMIASKGRALVRGGVPVSG